MKDEEGKSQKFFKADFLSRGMPKMKIKRIPQAKKTIKNSYGL
ncbi:MAG TPA: hypothetical protein VFH95_04225 [Candidatus Kapabacteria bacterium]|nr:hypothetical protein [Candidatus Kapabacteria bacterium]